jgi:hypothetical protein
LLAKDADLLAEIERRWERIPNITPNGMVVPKGELNLEYNLFVSAFAALTASLGIDDLIEGWVNPPNLHVKEGLPCARKLARPYASERRHTEAWIALNTARYVSVSSCSSATRRATWSGSSRRRRPFARPGCGIPRNAARIVDIGAVSDHGRRAFEASVSGPVPTSRPSAAAERGVVTTGDTWCHWSTKPSPDGPHALNR